MKDEHLKCLKCGKRFKPKTEIFEIPEIKKAHQKKGVRLLWAYHEAFKCPRCGSTDVMLIIGHRAYCGECLGKIKVARENEAYTKREVACSECGLVYED